VQSFVAHDLGRILLFYPKVREVVTANLFIPPDNKSSHALKEEENNSVQGNMKLSRIVFMT